MCGRVFLSTDGDAIAAVLGLLHDGKATGLPRADLPPTVTVPVAAVGSRGPVLTGMRWGLVPRWWRDARPPNQTFNARRETLLDAPSFRGLVAERRAVVVVSGFYEWQGAGDAKASARKTRHAVRPVIGDYLWLAGLWDSHRDADGGVRASVTVITQPSEGPLQALHSRMPWLLAQDDVLPWIDPATPWSVAERLGAVPPAVAIAAVAEAAC
jgi:putative SOS response-associated peptidase YedK